VTDLWVKMPEDGFDITLNGTSDIYLTPDYFNATNTTQDWVVDNSISSANCSTVG